MKCLIYISYDSLEYINYFHLAIDDKFVMNYVPIESAIDLLINAKEYCSVNDYIDWYIISDKEASYWDFESIFKDNDFELSCKSEWNDSEICEYLSKCFNENFCMDEGKEEFKNQCKVIKRIYPQMSQNMKPKLNIPDVIKKVEDNLEPENRAEKMTELAQIILEKYGRG